MTIKKPVRRSKKLAKKTSSAKTISNRRKTGKASAEKGKKFEDQVADLYRLLGAKVVQNIEIHQKKVDILATFRIPGSSREHTVIVECKDEGRAVAANERIMAFKGLLDVARASDIADSAEIITRKPWSDQAKGFAKSSGVELFSYIEKVSQLIDFTSYLKVLVNRFDKLDPARPSEPPLGSYYVDLSAQRSVGERLVHVPIIDDYIRRWLAQQDSTKQLAIFGGYGSGKSTLCQKLARDMAASYLADSTSSRIPILLNLRDFIGKLDLEAYITSFLDRECKVVNPKIELFRAMNEAGIFLLIFDGFDEMAVKVDADILESNLLELEKLAASKNSRVMLTSRPEYFITSQEESEVLNPDVNPFLTRTTEYESLKLWPWDETQIEEFLQKRVPLVKGAKEPWTYYRDRIKELGSLADLSQRPVLLDMIVKTLPRLISSGETINLPNLYKNYLIGEMKRQKILKKRSFLLDDNTRLELLQELAVQIYGSPTQSITFADALKFVGKETDCPQHELEAHTRDFLTNSFLIRKDDEYRVSHKSILEFLVAMRLHKEIESDKPVIFSSMESEDQVLNFLREFDPNLETLIRWIQRTRELDMKTTNLGPNAAELAVKVSKSSLAGKDLSNTDLSGAKLNWADLRGAQLHNAWLAYSELISARFYEEDFKSAEIEETEISFYLAKTRQTRRYSLNTFIDFAGPKLDLLPETRMTENVLFRSHDTYRPDIFWEIAVTINEISDIATFKDQLSTEFETKVAVFFDECEEIARQADARGKS